MVGRSFKSEQRVSTAVTYSRRDVRTVVYVGDIGNVKSCALIEAYLYENV